MTPADAEPILVHLAAAEKALQAGSDAAAASSAPALPRRQLPSKGGEDEEGALMGLFPGA